MIQKTLNLITAPLLLCSQTFADTTLEEINVITTNKVLTSIQDTTANLIVITAENIEENGYLTVAQAISHQTGMIVSQSGGIGQLTSIYTRGMNGGQTLILLDGMRLNDPSTPNGAAQLEMLTTSNIEQIEIIKGGASSIWGSNASAGVINIITKSAKDGVHGSLTLGYGSHDTKIAEVALSYKDEKLLAQVQASQLKTDGISAIAPKSAESDAYENESYNLKLGYDFDGNNKLLLSYNDIDTKTQYDAYAEDTGTNGDTKQKNYALRYTFTQGNYSAIFNATKSDIERHYVSDSLYGSYNSLNEASSQEYSLINQYKYDTNKFILGLEYKNIDGLFKSEYIDAFDPIYNSSDLRDTGYKNQAIFISNLYNIHDNTLLETNVRYDDFNNFDNKITYKIGVKHHHRFLEGFTTSANYYTAYDAPTTYQLAKQSPTVASLKPMYTKGFDISTGYKDLLNITYFNNKVDDGFQDIGFYQNPAYINNNGTEKFSGIEVKGNYIFSEIGINLSANYMYLIDYKKTNGEDMIRRPKETLNIALDHYVANNTSYGINAQYIGDRLDKAFLNVPPYSSYPVSTGNYTVWNLNFGTKISTDIDITINAKNIFDKEYQSVYSYATEGRSIYAKVKYSF